jgi:hypothetical protein
MAGAAVADVSPPPSRAGPRSGHSSGAPSPQTSTIGTAENQASGRQRRDGSRPSGNSRGTKVSSSPAPGAQAHWFTQLATSPPGTAPGLV